MAKTILLADDSVTIQKVVALTFMDQDYEVVPVGDGAAALAKLDEIGPDLVISDVHMPGKNGYEVCREVKEARPGTPVLLLVGTFEQFDEAAAREAGADGHLKKPFDSQELQQRVGDLISGAGAEEKPAAAASAAPAPEPASVQAPVMPPASGATAGDLEPTDAAVEPPPAASVGPSPPSAAPEETSSAPAEPAAPAADAPADASANGAGLSDQDVDRVARRVVELMGEKAVREVAWEVIPDLAEVLIKERLRELESQVE